MIRIVPYNEKYKKETADLILDVYDNELGFKGYERPDIHDITNYYLKKPNNNFWIALDGDKLVGTVGILGKTEKLAYLKRLIIEKEYRHQGLGKRLLQTAINFAKEHGYTTIYAGTVKENPKAISFYEHLGFINSDDIPQDITAAADSICLKLDL